MADAVIDVVGMEELPQIVELYNKIFRPARPIEEFRRRYLGRYNILQMVARVGSQPIGFFLGFELKPDTFFAWFYGVLNEQRHLCSCCPNELEVPTRVGSAHSSNHLPARCEEAAQQVTAPTHGCSQLRDRPTGRSRPTTARRIERLHRARNLPDLSVTRPRSNRNKRSK